MNPTLKKAPLAMLAMSLCLMAPACGGGGGDDDPPVDPDASVVVTDGGSGDSDAGTSGTDAGKPDDAGEAGSDAGEADAGNADAGETGGCGAIDAQGVCDGNVLKYCDRGTLETSDCAKNGAFCREDPVEGASCATLEAGAACDVNSFTDSCQGEKRYYCDAGTVAMENCGDEITRGDSEPPPSGFCAIDDSGAAKCMTCPSMLGTSYYCAGTELKYCSNGVYSGPHDCADEGKTCGVSVPSIDKACIYAPGTPCSEANIAEGSSACDANLNIVLCKNNVLEYVDNCWLYDFSNVKCSAAAAYLLDDPTACASCPYGMAPKPSIQDGACVYSPGGESSEDE